MSRIAEEMASLHRVAREHSIDEELVLKIIRSLKEQVEKGRVASNVPGDVDPYPAIPEWHPGYKLRHPSVSQSLPVRKVMPAPAGLSTYVIGLVLDSNGDAVCSSYSGITKGNLSMTEYRKIGAREIEVLEQQGISVCQAVWPVVVGGGRGLGTIIQYTPADSEIPEAVVSRVSSEVEAMASSSRVSRSGSRTRAPHRASRSSSRRRAPPRRGSRSPPRSRAHHRRAVEVADDDDEPSSTNVLPVTVTEGMGELIDPITLEPIPIGSQAVRLECGHILSHSSYAQLRRSSTVGDKCPTCRHPIRD